MGVGSRGATVEIRSWANLGLQKLMTKWDTLDKDLFRETVDTGQESGDRAVAVRSAYREQGRENAGPGLWFQETEYLTVHPCNRALHSSGSREKALQELTRKALPSGKNKASRP